MKYFLSLILFLCSLAPNSFAQSNSQNPVEVVVAGLSHGHVHWILNSQNKNGIKIVGIYETNEELKQRFSKQYNLSQDLFFSDLEKVLDATDPEAVTAFGPIYDHLRVVKASAPRGIHVMVEKPLAVSLDHALQMKKLANRHNIHLLTNYETTWYSSNQALYDKFKGMNGFGEIRKMVAHHGHQGPKEIGVSNEFLDWLTDPKLNGGGALMDFGCYGANLMTWMMDGQAPLTVQAVTQQIKPHIYSEVEDEATIILTYPKAQGIIQASWNWPFSRKDMQVYSQNGYVFANNDQQIRFKKRDKVLQTQSISPRPSPYKNPFTYLASVVRDKITVADTDLSSLPLNMTVMKILEAAKKSAKTGKTIAID